MATEDTKQFKGTYMPKVEIKSKDQCKETNYNHIIQMYLNSQDTIHKSKKYPTNYNKIQQNIKKTKGNSPKSVQLSLSLCISPNYNPEIALNLPLRT